MGELYWASKEKEINDITDEENKDREKERDKKCNLGRIIRMFRRKRRVSNIRVREQDKEIYEVE